MTETLARYDTHLFLFMSARFFSQIDKINVSHNFLIGTFVFKAYGHWELQKEILIDNWF